jgi:hypothetical protein
MTINTNTDSLKTLCNEELFAENLRFALTLAKLLAYLPVTQFSGHYLKAEGILTACMCH